MKIDKYLFFRAVADEDNDDGDGASSGVNPTSIAIPARNITAIAPAAAGTLEIYFKSVRNHAGNIADNEVVISDKVVININTSKHKEVIDKILRAVTSNMPLYGDGFIDVCDDVTTNAANATVDAVRLSSDITGIADTGITVAAALT
jgi:hypothetical protein|tara:strand:+ start:62 stop:502 length:441 start_codon:yes stop_codon:yes gene_type:complete